MGEINIEHRATDILLHLVLTEMRFSKANNFFEFKIDKKFLPSGMDRVRACGPVESLHRSESRIETHHRCSMPRCQYAGLPQWEGQN